MASPATTSTTARRPPSPARPSAPSPSSVKPWIGGPGRRAGPDRGAGGPARPAPPDCGGRTCRAGCPPRSRATNSLRAAVDRTRYVLSPPRPDPAAHVPAPEAVKYCEEAIAVARAVGARAEEAHPRGGARSEHRIGFTGSRRDRLIHHARGRDHPVLRSAESRRRVRESAQVTARDRGKPVHPGAPEPSREPQLGRRSTQ
jgi:hypothetical protein